MFVRVVSHDVVSVVTLVTCFMYLVTGMSPCLPRSCFMFAALLLHHMTTVPSPLFPHIQDYLSSSKVQISSPAHDAAKTEVE